MIRQFILDWRLHCRSSILLSLLAELGGFVFGCLLLLLIMHLDDDPGSWFCMGTIFSLFVCLLFSCIFGAFSYQQEFQLALSMGRTRTAFMGSFALRLLAQLALGYILALGLYHFEIALYSLLFPTCGNDAEFTFLTNWKIVLPVILGLLVLSMFIGAIYGRWGKKSLWVFWVIWMFCCFVLPRMFDNEPGDGILDQAALGIRNVFTAVPLTAWIVVGVILAAGMVSTTVTLGKKQMVRI